MQLLLVLFTFLSAATAAHLEENPPAVPTIGRNMTATRFSGLARDISRQDVAKVLCLFFAPNRAFLGEGVKITNKLCLVTRETFDSLEQTNSTGSATVGVDLDGADGAKEFRIVKLHSLPPQTKCVGSLALVQLDIVPTDSVWMNVAQLPRPGCNCLSAKHILFYTLGEPECRCATANHRRLTVSSLPLMVPIGCMSRVVSVCQVCVGKFSGLFGIHEVNPFLDGFLVPGLSAQVGFDSDGCQLLTEFTFFDLSDPEVNQQMNDIATAVGDALTLHD